MAIESCACQLGDNDYDGPSFCKTLTLRARVDHTCCECGETIQKGEWYERTAGCWDGEFSVFKTCIPCREVRSHLFCGWLFGCIWDDIRQAALCDDLKLGGLKDLSKPALTKLSDFLEEVWQEMEDNDE